MSEKTDKEVLDEWIDEHIKATALAMEVVEEACYREVSVPHLVGHITSIYADQMPQFIDYVASGRAEERRLAQVARLSDENYQLSEENNQLRELVQSMYDTLSHETFPPDWLKDYEADMRELGIEVKE